MIKNLISTFIFKLIPKLKIIFFSIFWKRRLADYLVNDRCRIIKVKSFNTVLIELPGKRLTVSFVKDISH